jgi:ketosteroid isomerase-like protein
VAQLTPGAVYRAYNDAENAHDLEATARLVADDLAVEVNGRPQLGSAEDDAVANAELLRCYPDYHREIVAVVEAGDQAAVRWRMAGTPAPGLDLGPLDVHGCSFVQVADGRITRASLYVDGGLVERLLERARGDGAS